MKFIYVFNSDDKGALQKAGFILLKSDTANSIYVFSSDNILNFALDNITYVRSDVLTF